MRDSRLVGAGVSPGFRNQIWWKLFRNTSTQSLQQHLPSRYADAPQPVLSQVPHFFLLFFADHSSEKTVNLTSHHARRCLCRTVVNSFSHRDTVRRDSTRLEQPAQTLQMPELEQVLRVQMESRTNHFLIASDECRNACPISTDAFTNTGLTLRGH